MKLLIVGLGNPGAKYEKTRHNIGFMCIDHFLESQGESFKNDKKCHLAKLNLEGSQVFVLKPMEYMNLSGNCVGKTLRSNGIKLQNTLVVHDEIDFPFEKIKLKFGGGNAGHNGLKDIFIKAGGQNFHRIRVGISRPPIGIDVSDYVLSKFTQEEWKRIPEIQTRVKEFIFDWISERKKDIDPK